MKLSHRADRKGRSRGAPPFSMLPNYMTDSAAWRSLSFVSQSAFIEMLRLYKGHNNGQLAMAARALAERISCSKSHAARALNELEEKGFIGVQRVGLYGRRIASEYFLTLYRNDVNFDLPTKAFMRWTAPATVPKSRVTVPRAERAQENCRPQSHGRDCQKAPGRKISPTDGTHIDIFHAAPGGSRSAPVGSAVASEPLGAGMIAAAREKLIALAMGNGLSRAEAICALDMTDGRDRAAPSSSSAIEPPPAAPPPPPPPQPEADPVSPDDGRHGARTIAELDPHRMAVRVRIVEVLKWRVESLPDAAPALLPHVALPVADAAEVAITEACLQLASEWGGINLDRAIETLEAMVAQMPIARVHCHFISVAKLHRSGRQKLDLVELAIAEELSDQHPAQADLFRGGAAQRWGDVAPKVAGRGQGAIAEIATIAVVIDLATLRQCAAKLVAWSQTDATAAQRKAMEWMTAVGAKRLTLLVESVARRKISGAAKITWIEQHVANPRPLRLARRQAQGSP